jgi:hypothetical protein
VIAHRGPGVSSTSLLKTTSQKCDSYSPHTVGGMWQQATRTRHSPPPQNFANKRNRNSVFTALFIPPASPCCNRLHPSSTRSAPRIPSQLTFGFFSSPSFQAPQLPCTRHVHACALQPPSPPPPCSCSCSRSCSCSFHRLAAAARVHLSEKTGSCAAAAKRFCSLLASRFLCSTSLQPALHSLQRALLII